MLILRPEDPLFDVLNPICKGLKIEIIDVGVKKKIGDIKVFLVLWNQNGFGIDECAKAHRLILPRLELHFNSQDVQLEVSSPGLERVFKYQTELKIFEGRKVKIWPTGFPDWLEGTLGSIENENVTVLTLKGPKSFPVNTILKAKLNDL